jgi:hypothetical protein
VALVIAFTLLNLAIAIWSTRYTARCVELGKSEVLAAQHFAERAKRDRERIDKLLGWLENKKTNNLTADAEVVIRLDREVDGRWIAIGTANERNALVYGESRLIAVANVLEALEA